MILAFLTSASDEAHLGEPRVLPVLLQHAVIGNGEFLWAERTEFNLYRSITSNADNIHSPLTPVSWLYCVVTAENHCVVPSAR